MNDGLLVDRRRLIAGVGATAALALLGGCSTDDASDASDATEAAMLSMGLEKPQSLDPGVAFDAASLQVIYQLFEPLTGYDYTTNELVGRAAQSWEISEDAQTFTFHLRDAAFQNGDTVRAGDFKRAWERIVNPASALTTTVGASPHAYRLSPIAGYAELRAGTAQELAGVTCPDDRTLVVTLSIAYADYPYVLSHPALSPVPAAAEEDAGAFGRAPVGNGPYVLPTGWEQGSPALRLQAFSGYRTGAPAADTVRFVVEQDTQSAYRTFLTGELDVSVCPVEEVGSARSRHGATSDGMTLGEDGRLACGTVLSCAYLACNLASAPLDSYVVRCAISLAIDRQGLCDTELRGLAQPADDLIPPRVNGYRADAWEETAFDRTLAMQLLEMWSDEQHSAAEAAAAAANMAAAGSASVALAETATTTSIADPGELPTISLIYNTDGGHTKVLQAIVDDLAAVGITCELEPLELDEFYERLETGQFELARLDATTDYPTMESILYPLFSSAAVEGRNYTGFTNGTFDALMAQARTEDDEATRIALLQQADDVLAGELPVIPLYVPEQAFAASDAVSELVIDPCGYAHLADAVLTSS